MTFPVVAALAAAGWVSAIVAVLAFCKAAKDGQAMLDQAHAYRNEAERVRRERDVLDVTADVFLSTALTVWEERK